MATKPTDPQPNEPYEPQQEILLHTEDSPKKQRMSIDPSTEVPIVSEEDKATDGDIVITVNPATDVELKEEAEEKKESIAVEHPSQPMAVASNVGLNHPPAHGPEIYTQILLMSLKGDSVRITLTGVKGLVEEKQADPFVTDEDGNCLLHWSAWRCQADLTQYLLDLGIKYDTRNNLNQTPLHWAAMSGDIQSAKIFIDLGCSIHDQDADGYTAIHGASQFNRPGVLEFFKFYCEMNVNAKDLKDRTPLHWAAFKENIIIIQWLLSNGSDPFVQDTHQETALHIAVKNDKVRSLVNILKYAKNYEYLDLRNKNDQRPFDMAVEKNHKQMIQILTNKTRQENKLLNAWNTLTGNQPTQSNILRIGQKSSAFFILSLVRGILVDVFILQPNMPSRFNFLHWILWGYTLLCIVLWFYVHKKDPGFIPKPSDDEIQRMFESIQQLNSEEKKEEKEEKENLIEMNDTNDYLRKLLDGNTNQICVTCRVVKPLRSKHCSACQRCVRKFDHHCPWVHNCVGEENYRAFITYTLIVTSLIAYYTGLVFYYFAVGDNSILGFIFTVPLVPLDLFLIAFGLAQVCSHTYLISRALTTNEKINLFRYPHFRTMDGHIRNPFTHGCCKNWAQFCCGPCGCRFADPQINLAMYQNMPMLPMTQHVHSQHCKHGQHEHGHSHANVPVENGAADEENPQLRSEATS